MRLELYFLLVIFLAISGPRLTTPSKLSTRKREIGFQDFDDFQKAAKKVNSHQNLLKRTSTSQDAHFNGLWGRSVGTGLWGRDLQAGFSGKPLKKNILTTRNIQRGLWGRSIRDGRSTQTINGLWGRSLAGQSVAGLWGKSMRVKEPIGSRTIKEDEGVVHGLWGRSFKKRASRDLRPTHEYTGMWGKRDEAESSNNKKRSMNEAKKASMSSRH